MVFGYRAGYLLGFDAIRLVEHHNHCNSLFGYRARYLLGFDAIRLVEWGTTTIAIRCLDIELDTFAWF